MLRNKKCEGQCPYCGSDIIYWTDNWLEDEYYVYTGRCTKCDRFFAEYYSLRYTTTEYRDEENA